MKIDNRCIRSTQPMPEGPECHALTRKLNRRLTGQYIESVQILEGRYLKATPPGLHALESELDRGPLLVRSVQCKGKLISMDLDKLIILSTLGLSGSWTWHKGAHCGIALRMQSGQTLWFKDQLHYGTFSVTDRKGYMRKLKQIGPDMVIGQESVDSQQFTKLIRGHPTKTVAELLMSQRLLSGVGNYLKAEILFEARIAPTSQLDDLPLKVIERLRMTILGTCQAWLQSKLGTGPRRRLKVYGRRFDPNGNKVERSKTQDKRITHWVPQVQIEYTAY